VDRFAGILSVGIVCYPANILRRTKIVTNRISSSAHDALGDDFRNAAGFTDKARASLTIHVGLQGDVLQRRRPFLKRLATPGFWIGLIGALVGLLGAVTGFIGNAEKIDQGWIQATTSRSCIVHSAERKVQLLENKEEVLKEIPWYNETELNTNVEISACKLEPLVQNVKLRPGLGVPAKAEGFLHSQRFPITDPKLTVSSRGDVEPASFKIVVNPLRKAS
jgi:hypothetical protein